MGLEIRARLLHPIVAVGFCQMIHMRLQLEFVDRLDWIRAELDARVDPNGLLWFGTMENNVNPGPVAAAVRRTG
jgi:hypothetical protein